VQFATSSPTDLTGGFRVRLGVECAWLLRPMFSSALFNDPRDGRRTIENHHRQQREYLSTAKERFVE
jgi:hypothetical protein